MSDLPTHPLFLGDTWILQGSPAHPGRIASHPGCKSTVLSVNLFSWSSQPLDHEDDAISYSGKFRGKKPLQIDEKYDFREENSLALFTFTVPRMLRPQILQRNGRGVNDIIQGIIPCVTHRKELLLLHFGLLMAFIARKMPKSMHNMWPYTGKELRHCFKMIFL